HAADRVEWLAALGRRAAHVLILDSAKPEPVASTPWAHPESLALLDRQLDVSHPLAHGRARHAETTFDLAQGQSVTPEPSGHVPFWRFHSGKQTTEPIGRCEKRVAGIEPA